MSIQRVLARASGGNGAQRRASEESHLDEVCEGLEAEEPALVREAIEGRAIKSQPKPMLDCIIHQSH